MLSCSVGIMAYNEEANIGRLLEALLAQALSSVAIKEIIVVASGCTDGTEDVVRSFCENNDERVKLLIQERREGKASAINLFIRHATEDLVILSSADVIPRHDAVERLLQPFSDPKVGMTGVRQIPVNDPNTFMGFTVHLLWNLHHQISLKRPKMGEFIAFRKVLRQIPLDTAVDEASLECVVRSQGFELRYVPEATIHNKGAETVRDFLKQRRRIYAGHSRMKHEFGYVVATMSGLRILGLLLKNARLDIKWLLWTPAAICLEAYGRFLGWCDYRMKRKDHAVWDIARTTKEAIS